MAQEVEDVNLVNDISSAHGKVGVKVQATSAMLTVHKCFWEMWKKRKKRGPSIL